MSARRPRIAVVCDHFAPGYRAGGPIRSLTNLCSALHGEYDFWVYTRDRDHGTTEPFDLPADRWLEAPEYHVCYASRGQFPRSLVGQLRQAEPELVYLNSWFSAASVRALWTRAAPRLGAGLLIAPRGELSPGALALKRTKKRLYLAATRLLRPHGGADFHATSPQEREDIRRQIGAGPAVHLAGNLSSGRPPPDLPPVPKQPGELKLVFLARIAPVKNIEYVFALLAQLRFRVALTVVGPFDSAGYEQEIRGRAAGLPGDVTVTFTGAQPHVEVERILRAQHAFILPTFTENHCHAVVDAWSAGLPVVISDRTPWRQLTPERGGWDLALDADPAWLGVLRQLGAADPGQLWAWRQAALGRARGLLSDDRLVPWRAMFNAVLAKRRAQPISMP